MSFLRWDIVFVSRFPETIKCASTKCNRYFSINPQQKCTFCGHENHVSNIMIKPRPMILWVDQSKWHESMSFGIPLSTTNPLKQDIYNESIGITDYAFLYKDPSYNKPMRAAIHQSSRLDGCVLTANKLIGRITNKVKIQEIEIKLYEWLLS